MKRTLKSRRFTRSMKIAARGTLISYLRIVFFVYYFQFGITHLVIQFRSFSVLGYGENRIKFKSEFK